MNINRPLMPGWLKKAEQKLLLNKPGIWSTRTHLVVYYGILFIVFLTGLCFLDDTDVRASSSAWSWVGFVAIISVIAFTTWLIYLLRFNVFKKYGVLPPLHSFIHFILYFIATAIIVLFFYVPLVVESIRANVAYGDDELAQDINAINIKLCQVEYEALHVPWYRDSVIVTNNPSARQDEYDADQDIITDSASSTFTNMNYLDSARLNGLLYSTDSVVKINDSVYLFYRTPDYTFVSIYSPQFLVENKLLSSLEIYNQVFKGPPPANRAAIRKELEKLLQKYRYQRYYVNDVQDWANNPFDRVIEKYRLYLIADALANLAEKKYRWSDLQMEELARLFYYLTLTFTLLVFIFRHTTVKNFFLSLLTGVLLMIFTVLTLSVSNVNGSGALAWIIAYFVIFCIGAASTWWLSDRRVVTGIFINLFVFMAPVFPLLVWAWYATWKNEPGHGGGIYIINQYLPNWDDYLLYAETAGALLLLVCLCTVIHKMYRRWYSLPEE